MKARDAEHYKEAWKSHVAQLANVALDAGKVEDLKEFDRLRDGIHALIDRAAEKVFGSEQPAATGN